MADTDAGDAGTAARSDSDAEERAAPGSASSSSAHDNLTVEEIARIAAHRAELLDAAAKKMDADRKHAAEQKRVLTRQIRNQKRRTARLKSRARNLHDCDLMDLIAMNALTAATAKAKAKARAKAKAKAAALDAAA